MLTSSELITKKHILSLDDVGQTTPTYVNEQGDWGEHMLTNFKLTSTQFNI